MVHGLNESMIDIESIAEGLSKEARFAGQTPGIFYSVAQHSVLLMQQMATDNPADLMAALLHDAAEAYIGDQAKPIKVTLPDFNELEDDVQATIYSAFGCEPSDEVAREIKRLDVRMCLTEAMQLFDGPPDWVSDYTVSGIKPLPIKIRPWEWREAREAFLVAFYGQRYALKCCR